MYRRAVQHQPSYAASREDGIEECRLRDPRPDSHPQKIRRSHQALELQRRLIRKSLEKANLDIEQCRTEWTEAMREQQIVEKVQERRLHQWEHQDDAEGQKSQDEISIGRFVRTRRQN